MSPRIKDGEGNDRGPTFVKGGWLPKGHHWPDWPALRASGAVVPQV